MINLRSDSTTVPIADAKLSGPRDSFKKGFQKTSFFCLLKRDDMIFSFSCDLFVMHQGRSVSSNRATRERIVNKVKRIEIFFLKTWYFSTFSLIIMQNSNNNSYIIGHKALSVPSVHERVIVRVIVNVLNAIYSCARLKRLYHVFWFWMPKKLIT